MTDEFSTEDMLDTYLFESRQLLGRLQEIVLEQKDAEYFDEDSIHEIFRILHTLKGSAGIMMFDDITAVSHKLEDIFFYLRECHPRNVPHLELVEHVFTVVDFITNELDKLQSGETADGDASQMTASIDVFLDSVKGEKKKIIKENVHVEPQQFYIAPLTNRASHFYKIYLTYRPEKSHVNIHAYKIVYALKEIAEDLRYSPENIISDEHSAEEILKNGFKLLLQTKSSEEKLRKIIQTGDELQKVDICEITEQDFLQGFDRIGGEIHIDLESSVEEIQARGPIGGQRKVTLKKDNPIAPGDFVIEEKEPGKGIKLAKDNQKKTEKSSFISVDVKKIDGLMELMKELVMKESEVLENPDLQVPEITLDNFRKAAAELSKISTDLKNAIMSMRMVPLSGTFQKMNRIVFDVSRKLGKEIEFEMVGAYMEVDRNIVEHISAPLMHLIRNAVDHGIETKEERQARGKTEKARVTLSAKTEAGILCIAVGDNGKGLDREKILEKARQQGILDYTRPECSYTDKEVYQFITLPGFSTNEKITEFSGRGVGMDVVVSELQAIGGSLEIESTPGQGSIMNVKVPLTFAATDDSVMQVER